MATIHTTLKLICFCYLDEMKLIADIYLTEQAVIVYLSNSNCFQLFSHSFSFSLFGLKTKKNKIKIVHYMTEFAVYYTLLYYSMAQCKNIFFLLILYLHIYEIKETCMF